MTNAGWYPDPAGQPQTYRYWDGRSWSEQTTSNPYDPPPGVPPAFGQEPTVMGTPPAPPPGPGAPATPYAGATPPPPPPAHPGGLGGGYGQPPYQPGPPPPGSGGGAGRWVLLAVVGVVLLALVGVGGFFGVRALTDDDGGSSADDTSAVTDEATDEATDDDTDPTDDSGGTEGGSGSASPESTEGITPTTQHCTGGDPTAPGDAPADGQLHGGGLTVPNPKGYTPEATFAAAFVFADSVQPTIRQIEEQWISLYAVGGLRRDNGFDSPAQAAELLVQCMTGSDDFYRGFTGREDLRNGPVTIDGRSGHEVYTEVRIEDPDIQAEGDLLHVIVVDTGDDAEYALYISMAPIGDQQLSDRQEQTAQQITVD